MATQKDQLLDFTGVKELVNNIKALITNHTHKYAGSSTEGGSANSAVKLETARNIGNALFDGTTDVTLSEIGAIGIIDITREEYNNLIANNQIDENKYYNITDEEDFSNIIQDNFISTNTSYSSQKIEKSFSKKNIIIKTTLSASKWTGTSAPFSYTLNVTGVTDSNIVEINYAANASEDAIKAYQGAGLRDGGQSTDKLIILAATKKPTIDIPIIVIISDAVIGDN